MAMDNQSDTKIKLYTSWACPVSHRVQIVLAELKLPYEKETIDLTKPRSAEYLAINPRGLMPTLSYNGENIPESAVISQFLVDAYPECNLLPAPTGPEPALRRAKIAFFVDSFMTFIYGLYANIIRAKSDEDADKAGSDLVAAVVKHIEPLLQDARPYFGGSETLTMAEVMTVPFFLRLHSFSKHGVFPAIIARDLPQRAPKFNEWANRSFKHPSVTTTFDEQFNVLFNKSFADFARGKTTVWKTPECTCCPGFLHIAK